MIGTKIIHINVITKKCMVSTDRSDQQRLKTRAWLSWRKTVTMDESQKLQDNNVLYLIGYVVFCGRVLRPCPGTQQNFVS